VRNLRKIAQAPPTMAPVQVVVVADAEHLVPQESSQEAANALLKLLEEPPSATRFILTSSEPGRLLPTIRSRSVPLHLARMDAEEVSAFLERHAGVDADTAARAARLGQGSIGRALGFLADEGEPGTLESRRREAFELVQAALSPNRADRYLFALGHRPAGARSLVELFAHVEEWLRDLAAVAAEAEDRVLSQDSLPRLRSLARGSGLSPASLARALSAVEEARELARGNVNPQLVVSGLANRLRRMVEATSGVETSDR
jgi:DNA polymerase-3 subunit delta'